MSASPGRRLRHWLPAQIRPGQMDDPGAVVLAVAVVVGALAPVSVPVVAAVVGGALAMLSRTVVVLWVAGAVLASALAAQAWAGMAPPAPAAFAGTVALARDPEQAVGAWRVEVIAGDRRFEAWARGEQGARLADRAAGQRVELIGRVEPIRDMPWLTARHVVGRLVVERVGKWEDGGPVARVANAVRALLRRGAEPLPRDQRALFLGFVLGDDRGQPVEVADDFDAAGLQHLLVVSGQNVAFLLIVLGPLLRRFGLRSRLVVTAGVLAMFATITRFEPSVLRATVMAGLASLGVTLGRRASGVRLLALAVGALVVADPFLVHSVGFRLSVAASAGILLLARPLELAIPGPRVIALPLAVTVAAQVGVAPVLIPTFGPMPVAAVPANLLAEPVAGLVMMWGCSAGLLAGLVGGPVASVLQWPTGLGIGWVTAVARWAAELPLGRIGLPAVALIAAVTAFLALGTGRRRLLAMAVVVTTLVVSIVPGVVVQPGDGLRGRVELPDATIWRGSGPVGDPGATVLAVDGNASAARLLAAVREMGVGHLDLVIARSGGSQTASTVAALRSRISVGTIWAPYGHDVADAVTPTTGVTEAGGVRLDVRAVAPRLDVAVVTDDMAGSDGPSGGEPVRPRQ